MSEFDYRKFLAENKLTKVAKGQETGKAKILSEGIQIREGFDMDAEMDEANAQKDAYLQRKEREKRGNWKGSVGAFVETHGDELGKVATSRQSLVDYIENVMKPELNDEAKGYVDNLVATVKSPYKLLMSLYNATLKGSGLGLNEGEEMLDEKKMESLDLAPVKDTLRMLKNHFKEAGHLGHGMVSIEFREGEPVEVYHNGNMIGQIDLEESDSLMEMALNHASLGGERNRKKPGVKPGSANQDKMSKSEMKSDEIEVTIGGVKRAVSQRAFNKYRKMTDPEEKKAWKKKYGFTQ